MTITMTQSFSVTGTGLITGLPVTATVALAEPGTGIRFEVARPDGNTVTIPATLDAVVQTDRGVTLAHPSGQTLSIVEHFLSACAMAGHSDLVVTVSGGPELPLLDGSAQEWLAHLDQHFGRKRLLPDLTWGESGLTHDHGNDIRVYALPAEHLVVTYALDYPEHPDLVHRWVRWDSQEDGVDLLAQARTWGFVKELPLLQAQGLAKGVSTDNTLGLTEDGSYTSPLRFADEPVYHKILDLLGDLHLMGVNPLRLKAHIFALKAGHGSHVAFAKKLKPLLNPVST